MKVQWSSSNSLSLLTEACFPWYLAGIPGKRGLFYQGRIRLHVPHLASTARFGALFGRLGIKMYYNETINLRFFLIRSYKYIAFLDNWKHISTLQNWNCFVWISERGIFMDVLRSCRPNIFRLASLYRFSHVLTFCLIEIALCGRFHRMRCWSLSLIRHIWSCLVLLPSLTVSICLQPRLQRLLVFQYGGGCYIGKREDPGDEVDLFEEWNFFCSYGSHVSCSLFL